MMPNRWKHKGRFGLSESALRGGEEGFGLPVHLPQQTFDVS
jgi:hypothetical protein